MSQTVSAADFQKSPGLYQDQARREPLTITKHGRPDLVVMSAAEYDRLKRRDRQAGLLEELSEADRQLVVNSLRNGKAPPELDELMD